MNDKTKDRVNELEGALKRLVKIAADGHVMRCEFSWDGSKEDGHIGRPGWLSEAFCKLDNGGDLDQRLTNVLTELFSLIECPKKRVILAQIDDGSVRLEYK